MYKLFCVSKDNMITFHFAHILEETLKSKEVNLDDDDRPYAYLLSLLATSVQGFPEKEHFLYDVATELELQGFRVKFLSVKDIKEFYEKNNPDYDEKKIDIYEMTRFFISMHKGSSFFLDEVPFTAKKHYLYKSGNNHTL